MSPPSRDPRGTDDTPAGSPTPDATTPDRPATDEPSPDATTPDGPVTDAATGSRRGAGLVGAGILVSRLTGLVRERAISHFLGTSFAADAFAVAFRLPNMLQHLLGEGVLSASFIPVYSRLLGEGRDEEAGRVARAVLGLLLAAIGTAVAVGVLLAEPLTTLVAAGLRARPETFDLAVQLVRLLFPATGFLVVSAWCLGVLNSHRRFFLSYVAPALFNVVQIAVLVTVGTMVTRSSGGTDGIGAAGEADLVVALAVGTIVAGAVQFGIQVPSVWRLLGGMRPSLDVRLEGVRTTIRAFLPVVGARGVVQVSTFINVLLASFLAAGALASLRYAQILYSLPIALFGMAVAAAELPELSRVPVAAPDADTAVRVRTGLARIAAFVAPTVMGYLLLGDLVVGALFQSGQFVRLDTVAVWIVLGTQSVGLLASTSSRLLQSALYGRGDPRTPSRVAVLRIVVSVVVGTVLMLQLDRVAVTPDGIQVLGDLPAWRPLPATVRAGQPDIIRLGAAGLGAAAAIGAWLEYVLLRRPVGTRAQGVRIGGGQLPRIAAATTAAAGVAIAMRVVVGDWPVLLGATAAIGATGATYVVVAHRLQVTEVVLLAAAMHRRLARPRG